MAIINGDDNDNVLDGTSGDDVINAFGGDDVVRPGSGVDQVYAGDGDDLVTLTTVSVGYPNSYLDGGTGFDTLNYGVSASYMFWAYNSASQLFTVLDYDFRGFENLIGGSDRDVFNFFTVVQSLTIRAGNGADEIYAGSGNDWLYGEGGNDTLRGGDGVNHLFGGEGDDTLELMVGNGTADGGSGIDTLVVYSTADLAAGTANSYNANYTFTSIENVTVGSVSSSVSAFGDAADNILRISSTFLAMSAANFDGRGGNDSLYGSSLSDVLRGGDGADRVEGLNGNDQLFGDAGDDELHGGAGDDTLNGGVGTDTADYSDTFTPISVSLAVVGPQDTLGAGLDTFISIENLRGGSGNDVLNGNPEANVLYGSSGADLLWGGEGDDTLDGGSGNDELVVTPWDGADALIGGSAVDFVSYQPSWYGVFVILSDGAYGDTFTGIEGITGSNFDDVLSAGTLPAKLYGGMGNDVLVGGPGEDMLNGGYGDDYLYVTAYDGADVIDGGPGYDILSFGGANTPLFVDLGSLYGDSVTGIEAVQGSKFDDTMSGTAGNDRIDGNDGNDVINAGAGDDVILMRNWDGADTVDGGEGSDTVSYEIANTGISASLVAPTYGDTFTGIEHLTGSAHADTLIGDGNANRLAGLAGNDTLTGGAGADTFVFNTAPNAVTNLDTILDFMSGTDKLEFSKSVFDGLDGTGALSAEQFRSGAGVASAQDADDRFVYDTSTGVLYFDSDGVGGVDAVQVAVLGTAAHPSLSHADLLFGP